MNKSQRGHFFIVSGLALIVVDWILISWFHNLILTFFGIFLCCSGIIQSTSARKSESKPNDYQIKKS